MENRGPDYVNVYRVPHGHLKVHKNDVVHNVQYYVHCEVYAMTSLPYIDLYYMTKLCNDNVIRIG